jgi:putative oxidoreductase
MLHTRLERARPYVLSLFRIVIGLLFTCHGIASLFGVLGNDSIPAGTWPGWYAALIQLAGGVLVACGLGTRWAAFIGSGSMAFAYFDVHQHRALLPIQNGGEAAAVFSWTLLLIVFAGPGPLSLDGLLARRRAAGQDAGDSASEQGGRPQLAMPA